MAYVLEVINGYLLKVLYLKPSTWLSYKLISE